MLKLGYARRYHSQPFAKSYDVSTAIGMFAPCPDACPARSIAARTSCTSGAMRSGWINSIGVSPWSVVTSASASCGTWPWPQLASTAVRALNPAPATNTATIAACASLRGAAIRNDGISMAGISNDASASLTRRAASSASGSAICTASHGSFRPIALNPKNAATAQNARNFVVSGSRSDSTAAAATMHASHGRWCEMGDTHPGATTMPATAATATARTMRLRQPPRIARSAAAHAAIAIGTNS